MKEKTSIIYCSSLVSDRIMDYLFQTSNQVPMQSAFKFHKLFAEGFSMNNCKVFAISSIPVTQTSNKKLFWVLRNEIKGGIKYYYLPIINIFFIKHLMVFTFAFFKVFYLRILSGFKAYVVNDALLSCISSGALCACKITGGKSIGIITDLPQMLLLMPYNSKFFFFSIIKQKLIGLLLNYYDGYVLLTNQMNEVVNKRNKPFRIIEGLVDINMKLTVKPIIKNKTRVILYSGVICEKYGIRLLLEAFMCLKQSDIQLSIFGNGDMANEMSKYCEMDRRIKYYGVLPNEKIVEEQKAATLLVNPRSSKEEFTKFSFPSKNMEYMASGTPMVTAPLPGMPIEYHDYVFIFDDETVEGFIKTFNFILSLPEKILYEKGQSCKKYVMEKKNNIIQSAKILDLLEKV